MGNLHKAVVGFVAASLCVSVLAQEKTKAKEVQSKPLKIDYSKAQQVKVTDQMKANFSKFFELRRALFAEALSCQYQVGGVCVIDIPIHLVTDPANPANPYCVAVFPEVVSLAGTAVGSPSNDKIIVWRLIPPSSPPAGATFTFFDKKDHGIIVLEDKSSQLKNGALGDGTILPPNPPDATKYMFGNKHNAKDKAVYLPIVVRTDNPTDPAKKKVSVCGTPDPTISNVD